MRIIRGLTGVGVTCLLIGGCGAQDGGTQEEPGEVQVALAAAPSDAGCFVLTAVPAGSTQPLKKSVGLTPGAPTTLAMGGLPQGSVVFSGDAFPGSCPPSSGASPSWVSQPVSVNVRAGATTSVSLSMSRPGSVNVTVDFPGTCASGEIACRTASGNSTCLPVSSLQGDRNNCGACGNICPIMASCVAGSCVTPNPCGSGAVSCKDATGNSKCIPVSTLQGDRNNCGACGHVCLNTQRCIAGQCG